MDPTYPNKTVPKDNRYAFNKRAVLARGQTALRQLYDSPAHVIAVVSHAGFLRNAITGKDFGNADYRICTFRPVVVDDAGGATGGQYQLEEWPETEEKGGGLGTSRRDRAQIEPTDYPNDKDEQEIGNAHGDASAELVHGESIKREPAGDEVPSWKQEGGGAVESGFA